MSSTPAIGERQAAGSQAPPSAAPASGAASRAPRPAAWRRVSGFAASLAPTVAVLAALQIAAPVPAAHALLLVAVGWAAYRRGAAAGLAASALVLGWGLIRTAVPPEMAQPLAEAAAGAILPGLAGGALAVMIGVHRGRAVRATALEATRQTARWVEDLVHGVDAVLWEGDPEKWKFTFVSEQAERMFGHPVARWMESFEFWAGLIHPEDRDRVLEECRLALLEGRDHQLEYRMVDAAGRIVWVRDCIRFVGAPGSRHRRLRGVILDITRQKREEAFRAGQQRILEMVAADEPLDRILDHLALAIEAQLPEARCLATRLDPAENRLEIVSAPSLDAGARRAVRGMWVELGQGSCGAAAQSRTRVVVEDVDEDPLWEGWADLARKLNVRSAWSQPVFTSGGRLLGTFCILKGAPSRPSPAELEVLEDAARLAGIAMERQMSEEEIRHSLSLLKATLESTADGILVVDTEGRIVSFNQRFLDLWRIPEEIVEARNDDRAIAFVLDQLKNPQEFVEKVRALYSNPREESLDVLDFKDGRVFERLSRPQMIGDTCAGRVWSFRDVTDRRRAEAALVEREEQLRHAQKMEAVGRLAGGIAHDFNNLLTAITGYSDLALRALSGNDPIRPRLQEIRKASESATALTRQLLAFGRKQVFQLQILDLDEVVDQTSSLLRRTLGEDVELVICRSGEAGSIRGDQSQLEQVLVNLAVNARDAMPGGGKLIIETWPTYLDEPYARCHAGVSPGHYVVLSISDTGSGMDSETRSHIFEPFFTTKEVGRGTGLGLATVYGIVKQSGGNIWVYSEPGKGTTFKIYLPMVEKAGAGPREAPVSREMASGSGTVLLVEDDDSVRGLVAVILEDCGYRVVEARNGDEGLQAFETSRTPIDLIVTDVVMPVMSGKDMAARILASRPETKILFISGYTQTAVKHHGLLESGSNFLQKPFSPGVLTSKVRALLEEEAPA